MPTRLTLMIMSLMTLTACATIEGAGQDLSAAGSAVSSTARDVRNSM